MPKRFAIYCRVSSDGQEDNSSLHEIQEPACRAKVRDIGHVVSESHVYHEVASAAYWFERPKLMEMMLAISRKEVDGVVAWKLDRISRDQAHLGLFITEMERHGAVAAFAVEEFDDTPEGKLLMNVKAFVAEMERLNTKQRTTLGRMARLNRGLYPGAFKAAYGYRRIANPPDGGHQFEIVDEEFAVLRRFITSILAGGSARQFARRLTEEGVPTPTGGKVWAEQVLRKMLHNPIYVGKAVANRTQVIRSPNGKTTTRRRPEDEWIYLTNVAPAIFSEEEVAAAKRRLSDAKLMLTRNHHHPHDALLRAGFARCGYCGGAMRVTHITKTGYVYTCNTSSRDRHGCPSHAIKTTKLDGIVWGKVVEVLEDPAHVIEQLRLLTKEDLTAGQVEAIDQRIATLDAEMANLAESIGSLKNPHAIAAVSAQLDDRGAQRDQLVVMRDERLREREEWQRTQQVERGIAEWCGEMAERASHLTYDQKHRLLRALSVRAWVWATDHKPRWQLRIRLGPNNPFEFITSGGEIPVSTPPFVER